MEKEIKELQDKLDALKLRYEQSKQPFKNGDVVEYHNGTAILLITDIENAHGYGVNNGEWESETKWSFNVKPKFWKLSTSEKWLEALTKEAVKMGFKDGVKINQSTIKKHFTTIIKVETNNYELETCGLTLDGYWIMHNGIWAEVIKEETLEELAERYQNYVVKSNANFDTDFINFFNENKETINRLSKL